jgi:hypothetical protein
MILARQPFFSRKGIKGHRIWQTQCAVKDGNQAFSKSPQSFSKNIITPNAYAIYQGSGMYGKNCRCKFFR